MVEVLGLQFFNCFSNFYIPFIYFSGRSEEMSDRERIAQVAQ